MSREWPERDLASDVYRARTGILVLVAVATSLIQKDPDEEFHSRARTR